MIVPDSLILVAYKIREETNLQEVLTGLRFVIME